jgi:hypothetical protein
LGSRTEKVEREVEKLINKYRDTNYIGNKTIITKGAGVGDGFFLILISKKNGKAELRQFGENITTDTIIDGILNIFKGFKDTEDTIGIA